MAWSLESNMVEILCRVLIGSVWVFHGLYSKILNGIPRHRLIVCKVLGNRIGGKATKTIGLLEVLLGLWVFVGWQRIGCAVIHALTICGVNTFEILLAGDLLISAVGMVILNSGFLTVVWYWAVVSP